MLRTKEGVETPCWWIANGKECFKGDQCAFKHLMSQVQGQTESKTGVSSPSLATDRDGNRTKVPLPRPVAQSVSRPSATPEFLRSVAKSVPCSSATPEPQRSAAESVPHVSSSLEFQGSAVSALCSSEEQELKEDLGRDYWIKVWDECSSSDSLFDDCSDDSPPDSGTDAQHEFYNDTGWHSGHWKRESWHASHCRTTEEHWEHDSWHSSHWRMSNWPRKDRSFHGRDGVWNKHIGCDSWNSSHWKTIGWDQKNEHHHDHTESQWFTHAFFEALSVDQLMNSLHRGEGDTTTFTGLEVDPGESLADTAAQSGIIDLRHISKGRRGSLLQVWNETSCHQWQ